MTTEKAMEELLSKKSFKKKYKKNTLMSLQQRFRKKQLTLDKMCELLQENGYFIRAEINWGRKGKDKEVPVDRALTGEELKERVQMNPLICGECWKVTHECACPNGPIIAIL